jgi:aquaporin Z
MAEQMKSVPAEESMSCVEKMSRGSSGSRWITSSSLSQYSIPRGGRPLQAFVPALRISIFGGFALTRSSEGHIPGWHLNPAVSIGLAIGRRFHASHILPYVAAQVAGAVAGAVALYAIASGRPGGALESGFAANGYGLHSPGGYSLGAGLIAEIVLTMMFLFVILGATDDRSPRGFAPLAIGLALTLIHLVGIPVTNLSVNPARSTGPAIVGGGWALAQLWMFWVAPIIGATLGAMTYGWIARIHPAERAEPGLRPAPVEPIEKT